MKRLIFILIVLMMASSALSQEKRLSVTANTNGVLLWPTNFFLSNSVALAQALSAAGILTNGGATTGDIATYSAITSNGVVAFSIVYSTTTSNGLATLTTNWLALTNTALTAYVIAALQGTNSALKADLIAGLSGTNTTLLTAIQGTNTALSAYLLASLQSTNTTLKAWALAAIQGTNGALDARIGVLEAAGTGLTAQQTTNAAGTVLSNTLPVSAVVTNSIIGNEWDVDIDFSKMPTGHWFPDQWRGPRGERIYTVMGGGGSATNYAWQTNLLWITNDSSFAGNFLTTLPFGDGSGQGLSNLPAAIYLCIPAPVATLPIDEVEVIVKLSTNIQINAQNGPSPFGTAFNIALKNAPLINSSLTSIQISDTNDLIHNNYFYDSVQLSFNTNTESSTYAGENSRWFNAKLGFDNPSLETYAFAVANLRDNEIWRSGLKFMNRRTVAAYHGDNTWYYSANRLTNMLWTVTPKTNWMWLELMSTSSGAQAATNRWWSEDIVRIRFRHQRTYECLDNLMVGRDGPLWEIKGQTNSGIVRVSLTASNLADAVNLQTMQAAFASNNAAIPSNPNALTNTQNPAVLGGVRWTNGVAYTTNGLGLGIESTNNTRATIGPYSTAQALWLGLVAEVGSAPPSLTNCSIFTGSGATTINSYLDNPINFAQAGTTIAFIQANGGMKLGPLFAGTVPPNSLWARGTVVVGSFPGGAFGGGFVQLNLQGTNLFEGSNTFSGFSKFSGPTTNTTPHRQASLATLPYETVNKGQMDARFQTNSASFVPLTNDIPINVYQTNNFGGRITVSASALLTAVLTGTAEVGLWVDHTADGTWDTKPSVSLGAVAGTAKEFISKDVSPGGRFIFTNLTTATGAEAASIVSGSCEIVIK